MKRRAAVQPARPVLGDVACAGSPQYTRRLFADYFLKNLLRSTPPWKEHWQALKKEAAPLKEQMYTLFKNVAPSLATSKAQTERAWIQPVLALLGHTFDVQVEVRVPGGIERLDYVFYTDEPARVANRGRIVDESVTQQGAFAVGSGQRWLHPLDQAPGGSQRSGDTDHDRPPSVRLSLALLHTRCPWGIVTNGKQWRLSHKDTAHTLETFYDIDLPDLLEDAEIDSFFYFCNYSGLLDAW